jgi:hypothetical protein
METTAQVCELGIPHSSQNRLEWATRHPPAADAAHIALDSTKCVGWARPPSTEL